MLAVFILPRFWSDIFLSKSTPHALAKNLNFRREDVLGLPGTFLDAEVFYSDAPFLKNAPYMQTMIANPNHISCHTLGESEAAFTGTQEIERALIDICARQIFSAGPDTCDGYVASGGTTTGDASFSGRISRG